MKHKKYITHLLSGVAMIAFTSSISFAQDDVAKEQETEAVEEVKTEAPAAEDTNAATTAVESKKEEVQEQASVGEDTPPPLLSEDVLLQVMEDDIVIGSADAPVTMIEYASMTCSHCAHFHRTVYKELKSKYIDTGKLKYVLRDFPLDLPALHGSMMVRCAPEDKYEKFFDALFTTQSNWVSRKNYMEVLSNIAKLGGMTGEQFDACIADEDLKKSIVDSRYQAANVLNVRSTPTIFVNGVKHKGSQSMSYYSDVIEKELQDANTDASSADSAPSVPVE